MNRESVSDLGFSVTRPDRPLSDDAPCGVRGDFGACLKGHLTCALSSCGDPLRRVCGSSPRGTRKRPAVLPRVDDLRFRMCRKFDASPGRRYRRGRPRNPDARSTPFLIRLQGRDVSPQAARASGFRMSRSLTWRVASEGVGVGSGGPGRCWGATRPRRRRCPRAEPRGAARGTGTRPALDPRGGAVLAVRPACRVGHAGVSTMRPVHPVEPRQPDQRSLTGARWVSREPPRPSRASVLRCRQSPLAP